MPAPLETERSVSAPDFFGSLRDNGRFGVLDLTEEEMNFGSAKEASR
jgi:hypothetical protein